MRLGKWEPWEESAMFGIYPEFTICETLRQIYHRTDDEEIKFLARIATTMAKHITNKLEQYHKGFNDETWTDKTLDVLNQLGGNKP